MSILERKFSLSRITKEQIEKALDENKDFRRKWVREKINDTFKHAGFLANNYQENKHEIWYLYYVQIPTYQSSCPHEYKWTQICKHCDKLRWGN